MIRKGMVVLAAGVMVFPGIVSAMAPTGPVTKKTPEAKAAMIKQLKEQKTQLRATYQEKLQLIKDEKKQQLTERIRSRMCVINANRTEIMNKHLDKMLQILVRVEEKATALKAEGKDITAITTAVEAARTAIKTAQTAVATQAETGCEISISGSETALSLEVRNSISGLEKKLGTVNEKVRTAKRAVSEAIVALSHTMGESLPDTNE